MFVEATQQSHGRVELNFDILYLVIEKLKTRPEILSVMKTCRILHYHGIRLMLRHRIDLLHWKPQQYESLLGYLRKHPRRLQYIEEVQADLDDKPYLHRSAIQVFEIIFHECFNLKKLYLSSCGGYGIQTFPIRRILSMQHNMRHLHTVAVAGLVDDAYLLLKGHTAPIVMLSLNFDAEFDAFPNSKDYPIGVHPRDPLPLLANFASTLEVLNLAWCHWTERSSRRLISDALRGLIPCPKVHTLNSDCGEGSPHVVSLVLMVLFPNLKHLQVITDRELNENFAHVHQINSLAQETSALAFARKGTKYYWENLEELDADGYTLYALALGRTKVNRLDVTSGCDSKDIRFISVALKAIRPNHLKLDFDDPCTIVTAHMDDVKTMLQYRDLSGLWLSLGFTGKPRKMIAQAIDHIIDILSGSSLKYLHLDIFENTLNEPVALPNDIGQYLKLNQEHIMEKIACGLPSLEHLSTHFSQFGPEYRHLWSSFKGWKITTDIGANGMKLMRENLDGIQYEKTLLGNFGSFCESKPQAPVSQ
ncbi:hypothetical protein C8Q75DRAFT_739518 [Abortiporus biennis]|nr:hypothetical protein C8Q75DRAFT_739518 [Abortiporus biennis]